ncbi:MAG: polymer-forming cytoskeletal protein, partial [Planctomycetaceae bacterium]|nr:polymer-forming cytoskeletal protein [Planctomycetaceae bacterium]
NVNSSATMAAVNQKIDALQTTLDQEQQDNTSDSVGGTNAALQNAIGKGTLIEGNVHAEGDLLVEGIVKGDVTTKTKLVVGPSALIEGNILAQHAEIAGRVHGTVKAIGLLVINSSGTILGDVITKDLNVESGSTFNGRLQVGGNFTTTSIEIPKVTVPPVLTSASSAITDSVFDSPAKKPVSITKSDTDKTAEQLAANLSKSALLQ